MAVKDGISPEPLAAKPIAVFEFVHVKLAPEGVLTKFVAGITVVLQATILLGTATETTAPETIVIVVVLCEGQGALVINVSV